MIAWLARTLVNTAARRWPESAGMRQEWLAELDFLASQGRWGQMLWFAGGLTFARPAHAPAIGFNWRTIGTFLLLIAGPVMIIAAEDFIGRFILRIPVINTSSSAWALSLLFVISFAIAALCGYSFGAMSVLKGPLVLAVLLTASICGLLLTLMGAGLRGLDWLIAIEVWAPALVILLLFVARASQRRRAIPALIIGLAVFLIVLDLAAIVHVTRWSGAFNDPQALLGSHAPLWLVHHLTGTSFGVLTSEEVLQVNDMLVLLPQMLIVFAVYTMAYAARAARAPAR